MKVRSPGMQELGSRLRRARKLAGLTGTQLALQLQWPQSKVSKLELGYQLASSADLERWAAACGMDVTTKDRIVSLAESLKDEREGLTVRAQRDPASLQEDYDAMVRQAKEIRNVEIAIIPGLLQTREYARHSVLTLWRLHGADPEDIEVFLDARMARSAALQDASKRFEFLISEGALRTFPCPRNVMRDQLQALLEINDRRGSVSIGILPMAAPLSLPLVNGFAIFDSVAVVESLTHEVIHRNEPATIYLEAAKLLREDAEFGASAAGLLISALEQLG